MTVEVIDPVAAYADLMETLFDFDAIRALLAGGFSISFDAMHAVTGPYTTEVLERCLRRSGGDGGERHPPAQFRRASSRPQSGPRLRPL